MILTRIEFLVRVIGLLENLPTSFPMKNPVKSEFFRYEFYSKFKRTQNITNMYNNLIRVGHCLARIPYILQR